MRHGVINKEAGMEPWKEMNTMAHLNAAFAARQTKKGRNLFHQNEMHSKDGQGIHLNIQHAIMIKTAPSNSELKQLVADAKKQGLEVAEFTKEMIESTSDKKVIEWTGQKDYSDIEHYGVLIFGKEKLVKDLTGKYPLYDK